MLYPAATPLAFVCSRKRTYRLGSRSGSSRNTWAFLQSEMLPETPLGKKLQSTPLRIHTPFAVHGPPILAAVSTQNASPSARTLPLRTNSISPPDLPARLKAGEMAEPLVLLP